MNHQVGIYSSMGTVENNKNETKATATVNEFGTVIFNKKGAITVYIKSKDGSDKMDSITIFAK